MRQQEKAFQLWDRAMEENHKVQEKLRQEVLMMNAADDGNNSHNNNNNNDHDDDHHLMEQLYIEQSHLHRSHRGEMYWQSKLDGILGSSEGSLKFDYYDDFMVDTEALQDTNTPDDEKEEEGDEHDDGDKINTINHNYKRFSSSTSNLSSSRPGLLKELSTKSLSTRRCVVGINSNPVDKKNVVAAAATAANPVTNQVTSANIDATTTTTTTTTNPTTNNHSAGRGTLLRSLSGLRNTSTTTSGVATMAGPVDSVIPTGSAHHPKSGGGPQSSTSSSRRRGSYGLGGGGGSSHHRHRNSNSNHNSFTNNSSHHSSSSSSSRPIRRTITTDQDWDHHDDPRHVLTCGIQDVVHGKQTHVLVTTKTTKTTTVQRRNMERAASLRTNNNPFLTPRTPSLQRTGMSERQLLTFQMSLKSLLHGMEDDDVRKNGSDNDEEDRHDDGDDDDDSMAHE